MNTIFLLFFLMVGISMFNTLWSLVRQGCITTFLTFDGCICLQRIVRILAILLGFAYMILGSMAIMHAEPTVNLKSVWYVASLITGFPIAYFAGAIGGIVVYNMSDLLRRFFTSVIEWIWRK